jgi:hypothetical protein
VNIRPFKNNTYKVANGKNGNQRSEKNQQKGARCDVQIEGGSIGKIELKKNGYRQKYIFDGFMDRHLIKAPR